MITNLEKLSSIPEKICETWKYWGLKQKIVARALIYGLLGFFVINFNPFGLNDMAELKSQEAIAKVLSPWYPFGQTKQTEKIVVVLVNGKSLDLISQLPQTERIVSANEWPILYKDHANILKTLVAHGSPKQIFIDIEFHKVRNTDNSFQSFLRTLDKLHTKKTVNFSHAAGGIIEKIPHEINQQFERFSSPVLNAWSSDFMPLLQRLETGEIYLSPALNMYKNISNKSLDLSRYEQEMFVFWRNHFDERFFDNSSDSSCKSSENSKALESVSMFFGGFLGFEDKERCYPHKVVYLDELQQMLSLGAEGKKQINKIFKDATVLYGTDYIALGDRYESPTHGTIPGVFYHAMALENLIEFDENYFKSFSKWMDGVLWSALSLFLIIIYFLKERFEYIKSHTAPVLGLISIYFILLIIITIWLRIAPANLLALLSLIGAALYLSSKEEGCQRKLIKQTGSVYEQRTNDKKAFLRKRLKSRINKFDINN